MAAKASSKAVKGPRVIYWFRTDLRLHDSPALKAALSLNPSVLYPIWTWDPHYVYRARVGPNRWQFLIDCQNDLSKSITALNPKQRLFVLREAPQTLFRRILKDWKIDYLVFEKDTDAYARSRDDEVIAIAKELGVQVIVESGRTLWDSDEIVKRNGGKPTMSITQLQAAGKKIGPIAQPVPSPTWLPDPGTDMMASLTNEQPDQTPDINAQYRDGPEKSYAKGLAGPNGDFAPPTMKELGLKPATTPHRGGESIALAIVDKVIADKKYTATFEKPKTAPTAFDPPSTCFTSAYLHFGSLSCRHFWWKIQEVLDSYKGVASQPPTSLQGQLLFRDMYFGAQAALGWSFAQTYNNSHCRFVPWHLPSKVDTKTGLVTGEYEVDDAEKEEWFQRWRHGRTGFPWIDAIMRQLRTEGWIHHLARHAVAAFCTRGGCYISWERGAEVFEELLIDHETSCNAGNWQWLSCVAFYTLFHRCYSPIVFPQKWDKDGAFVRKYCPELKDLPAKYIYEPWKAPIQDQKKAGVQIHGDGTETEQGGLKLYPKPMFDFAQQKNICMQGMKTAYQVHLYGDSPQVKDGSWKKLFDDAGPGPTEGQSGGPGGMTGSLKVEHKMSPKKSKSSTSKTLTPGKRKAAGSLEESFKKQQRPT